MRVCGCHLAHERGPRGLVLLGVVQLRVQRALEESGVNCLLLGRGIAVGEEAVEIVGVGAGLVGDVEELGRQMAALGAEMRARRVLEGLRCLEEALVGQGGLMGERLRLRRGEVVGRHVEALSGGGDLAEGGVAGCEGVVVGR